MDLSIIIVSWNVKNKLHDNLSSLEKSEGDFSYEIFVVDNNSQDGSAAIVEIEFPEVKLIANNKNLGFARANNQAIVKARGDFILLLNPDMRVFPDTLKKMLTWMKNNKRADVAGCHLVNETGETVRQVRLFPGISDQLMIVLKWPHLFPAILHKYLQSDHGSPEYAILPDCYCCTVAWRERRNRSPHMPCTQHICQHQFLLT